MSKLPTKILRLFREAAIKIPAYRSLLKKNLIRNKNIRTVDDFSTLPITDKNSYILKNALSELTFPDKNFPVIYASSGSSGTPTFWFQSEEQEIIGAKVHENIFRDIFNIKKTDKTLVVVCFSMGIWIAGNYTLSSCKHLSKSGYNITTVTPGLDKKDVLNVLHKMTEKFEHIIIAGYPPFIMDIVNEALKEKIKFDKRYKFVTAGEKFSEDWRDSLLKLLGRTDPYHSIINIYGSADAAILGHETPLSIFVRRVALANSSIYNDIFGGEKDLPALYQYYPDDVYFEKFGSELIFTSNTAIPLIRYNIHDVGTLKSYDQVLEIVNKYKVHLKVDWNNFIKWKIPFVVKMGRTDVAVTFYALNIFPEHIRSGIEDKRIRKFLSGSFLVYTKSTNNHKNQKLFIEVELFSGIKLNEIKKAQINMVIVENLIRNNIEYRKLTHMIGRKSLPYLIFKPAGSLSGSKVLAILNIKGKKPRMVKNTA